MIVHRQMQKCVGANDATKGQWGVCALLFTVIRAGEEAVASFYKNRVGLAVENQILSHHFHLCISTLTCCQTKFPLLMFT